MNKQKDINMDISVSTVVLYIKEFKIELTTQEACFLRDKLNNSFPIFPMTSTIQDQPFNPSFGPTCNPSKWPINSHIK